MLSQEERVQLYERLGLSTQAQQVIEGIRSSPPTRRVRSAVGNVSVRYPSLKMGVIIQAESHRNELAGIYEKEHDSDTLEYYDQPPRIKLVYQAKSGRRVGVMHTPDYFVIRTDGVGWEEWKMEAELARLAEEMPNRYVREEGRWRCLPGEDYAASLGFFYRVRSSAEIDWVFQRNMLFLEDYLREDCPVVSEEAGQAILKLVTEHPGMTLQDLLTRVEGASSDDIYTLIAQEQVYVDIRAAPLAEPERVRVFRDAATAQGHRVVKETVARSRVRGAGAVCVAVGTPVEWDGSVWTVVNVGETQTTLLAKDGSTVELPYATLEALVKAGKISNPHNQVAKEVDIKVRKVLAQASPADFAEANRRYTIIAPRLAGRPVGDTKTPARTIRDWVSKWRRAERSCGCGYVGLLPKRRRSGNRERKLPEQTLALLDEFIANDYETLKQKPKLEVYGALARACEAQGVLIPSYKTFAQAVDRRPQQEQTRKRQGRRAAYAQEPFYRELTLTTPRHGDRPFEIGHIDHTQLDVELRCSRTDRNLGRPWATFLSDTFSRRLLAVYVTFDPPSYRACMMILRVCVRRHNRLPQIVVVDGGAEFASIYFETLLARYACSKKTRPGGCARFGSVCERLFGTTNTRFIYNLMGNTQSSREPRQMTQAVNPKAHACWTLDRLYTRLCEWAYQVYDTIEHPALGQSPREAFESGMRQSGRRVHRLIPYDETLRMLTLPTTRKGTAKIVPRLGVKIRYIYYWSDAFLDPEVEKTQVPVRFDPFDAGTAYAYVKGRWVHCVSEHHVHFRGRSERELMLATTELRKRYQRHAKQLGITARKLADFVASLEAEEVLLEQRLRDAEVREVHAIVEGTHGGKSGAEMRAADSAARKGQEPVLPRGTDVSQDGDVLAIYEDY